MKGAAGAMLAGALLPAFPARAATVSGGLAFGTYWRAVLPAGVDNEKVSSAVEAVVALVDLSMSPYRPESEISRFNNASVTEWMSVSTQLCDVVSSALEVAALTEGSFDPTVGPLVHRFGFGPITGERAGSYSGISAADDAIRKNDGALTLDMCGIAKGYALDRMVAAVEALGIRDFMIELGGEVAARGLHPQGRPWQVAVEQPGQGATQVQRVLRLEGLAVATSGDSVNFVELDGQRYSHIIDPLTGAPVKSSIASVSVLAPTAMQADAWATALMASGLERGMALANSHAIPALFVVRDGYGWQEHGVAGFTGHLAV